MKLFSIHAVKLRACIVSLLAAMAFTSCGDSHLVFDYEGDCNPYYYVQYVYDMNMEWHDTFGSNATSVVLYVFDSATGNLVGTYRENDMAALSAPGYRMPVDLKPGTYDFVAWCGLENNQENLFTLRQSVSRREELECRMERQYEGQQAFQNKLLNALFYGKATASLPDEEGEHVVTVHLVKDINNIVLSMQHVSGEPLTTDMFTVTMSEANGYLAYDNSLKEDEDIEYRPWHVRSGSIDIAGTKADSDAEEGDNLNFFMAEISTGRLMKDRDPRINIYDNATGEIVYSIPIVKWATTFRSQQYKDANNNIHVISDDQEYLDRRSDYEVMIYLDNGAEGWLAAEIYINSWRVVFHEEGLK
ncbi:MAG: FimB/Mfa2 family fimbrial subunit [Prevotellaceae bacterium]|nr:FimB/Mfa2 family fimbrial subunit [Prevotellaceae bacterium]